MARRPESSLDSSIPSKHRARARDAEREEAPSIAKAPDVQALVQRTMQGAFGNQLVQAALEGESIEGLGEVIAAELAASAAGMGALSDDGAGLLALGNAALARVAKRVGGNAGPGQVIAELRAGGRGEALPTAVREEMEQLFGRDLSAVRIHTDTSDRVEALRAEAVALGSHLHFAEGRFNPNTREGRALLAHEITHVVQNDEGRLPGVSGVSHRSMGAEREAYANERLIDLPFVRAEAPVEMASEVSTAIEPSAHADPFAGALASSGTFGWSGASLGVGEVGAMGTEAGSLVGTVDAGVGGPVEASTSAPAMLRESDDIDQEESDTEAAARHEVAMGLDKGFQRAIDMSQGEHTVNVPKEGTGRKDGIFTGPSPSGHLAVDEYNAVMRDIGPDGESKSSGADEFLVDSAQHTQVENDGHVHLDGSPKLGARPETTATGPGGDPVMGGHAVGMVEGRNKKDLPR